MGTATDELKLDIAIKATGIDVIDITEDYKVFNVLKYCYRSSRTEVSA
jgi:hypothetical protein